MMSVGLITILVMKMTTTTITIRGHNMISYLQRILQIMNIGANSEKDVDVKNEQNNHEESWADNLSQEGSDGLDGGDDEAEMDIEEAQYQQQKLETHWKVMAMSFWPQGDAYIFYNKHAKEHGFSIRREKMKRGKGALGIIWFRRFVCSRAGRRQRKIITMEGRTRRLRPETRCECGA